ncbi:(2S)-3-sulfopropanediol dehydratase activating enzyme [Desulfovibrio desulfuricans]|uniref:(2S)-3-sulfopropanediol dehydratase activating enzyme n=1 Tax=Desulfovibrio desulfuricans TaxID=876 RepID=UPI001C020826|nr:glycyl-radical enzyme activating protein [Desulfovibrio desulfuricans]MBT9747949.1 glycyl-radical enzyme activating protein [Desulfovibrio desulfuricans]
MCLEDSQQRGMVFNIQKYSVHDGPGIRTIVFLKGCALSCRWCSNPESQKREPELAFNAGRCLGVSKCGHCIVACPHGSITLGDDDKLNIDRSRCAACDLPCAAACPAQGLLVYGKERTVDDVLNVVEQDMAFYARSGGGLTLSGGEPLLQGEFAVALLREARTRRIKTAVETCGMVSPDTIREAAPYLNYVLFDIKHMDSAVHEAQTGLPNRRILENFRILAEEFPDLPILARTPIIPGFNDSEEAIAAIAGFLKPFERVEYEMLPYHRLGTQKYQFLDRPVPMGDVKLETEHMNRLQAVAQGILGDRLRIPH